MHIIVGSQSPYRKEALEALGHSVTVRPANIDEQAIRHDDPLLLVVKLAKAKAHALLPTLGDTEMLLTADTVGYLHDGTILEKPADAAEVHTMVARYNAGEVVGFATGVVVQNKQKVHSGVAISSVQFHPIPNALIEETIQSGEAFRCAGGFTLSNEKTWRYVKALDGEKDTVVGFPSKLVQSLLQHFV